MVVVDAKLCFLLNSQTPNFAKKMKNMNNFKYQVSKYTFGTKKQLPTSSPAWADQLVLTLIRHLDTSGMTVDNLSLLIFHTGNHRQQSQVISGNL